MSWNPLKNKWLMLTLMALTWGSSFILIKKTLPVFDPYMIGSFRVGVSGLILAFAGIPALRKMKSKEVFWIAVAGFLGVFAPLFIFPIAQTRVSSSLAGMINALEPIFTIVIGVLLFAVRIRLVQIIGAVIGFAGAFILLFFSEASQDQDYLFYTMLMVLASVFYALSALIVKDKLQHIPTLEVSSGIYTFWMLPALVILGFSGFFTEVDFNSEQTWEAMGYLSFLTLISTTLAMILFYKLIQDTSAVFASTVSLLIPIVAVFWGIIDGEEFIAWYAVGGILILTGVYLIREKMNHRAIV